MSTPKYIAQVFDGDGREFDDAYIHGDDLSEVTKEVTNKLADELKWWNEDNPKRRPALPPTYEVYVRYRDAEPTVSILSITTNAKYGTQPAPCAVTDDLPWARE